MRIGAAVVTAGHKSSLSTFSSMLPVGDSMVIRRIIVMLKRPEMNPVMVVTGKSGDEVEKHTAGLWVICLHGKRYDRTRMYNSIYMGLNHIENLCDRVFILLTKFPLFLPQTIKHILESDATVICPVSEGRRGHPVLVSSNVIGKFLSYKGGKGLRGVVRQVDVDNCAGEIAMRGQGIIFSVEMDKDCPREDLKNGQLDIYPQIQLTLERNEGFFGPPVAQFLSLIDHTGSMQTACRQIYMSYTKGWKILKAAERELGYPLLITQSDGVEGGSSQFTPKAKDFLDRSLKVEEELMEDAQKLYQEYFYVEDEIRKWKHYSENYQMYW